MSFLFKLICSFLILAGVTLMAIFALLHTHYGLPIIQKSLQTFTPYQLQAKKLTYHFLNPFDLSIEKPILTKLENQKYDISLKADYLSISFAPLTSIIENITFNHLIASKLDLTSSIINIFPSKAKIIYLYLDKVNYKSDTISIHNANIQWENWRNISYFTDEKFNEHLFAELSESNSNFKLSITELINQRKKFTNFKIDGEFKQGSLELKTFDFDSPYGKLSSHVTWHKNKHNQENKWIFEQLIIRGSQIEQQNLIEPFLHLLKQWASNQYIEIKNVDLYNINIFSDEFSIENLNLSAKSILFEHGYFRQKNNNTPIYFNVDLLRYKQWLFTDFLTNLTINKQQINIKNLSAKINDNGFISLEGDINFTLPSNEPSLIINTLKINGLDLNLTTNKLIEIKKQLELFNFIKLNNFYIKDSHILSTRKQFPAQIISLDVKGTNLIFRENNQYGIWQGSINASANFASLNHIPISSPYLNIEVENNILKINPLKLFFENGQLITTATIDLNRASFPWMINAQGINVPNNFYSQMLMQYFPVTGLHDVELSLSGIANNIDSLAYSLSGEMKITPFKTLLKMNDQSLSLNLVDLFNPLNSKQKTKIIPLNLPELILFAERGKITLLPIVFKDENEKQISLSGEWDLVTKKGQLVENNQQQNIVH